uniref:RING-CH-type domain-containing protein n=1 Tax=Rhizophora mucronata TaxID=61149 RepID=A0A2P2KYC9_RHIMU
MNDHVALVVDRLGRPESSADQTVEQVAAAGPSSTSNETGESLAYRKEGEEEQPLIQAAECRICQEEDSVNNLETPCACSGSLKYAHRKCVQQWCNEKGDTTCEICHGPYGPGYTAPPRPPHSEDTIIDLGGGWTLSGAPVDLRDPHLLEIAEAEQRLLESEYDEYAASNASGAAFCRSAALVVSS